LVDEGCRLHAALVKQGKIQAAQASRRSGACRKKTMLRLA
jgi:hypothetical protein